MVFQPKTFADFRPNGALEKNMAPQDLMLHGRWKSVNTSFHYRNSMPDYRLNLSKSLLTQVPTYLCRLGNPTFLLISESHGLRVTVFASTYLQLQFYMYSYALITQRTLAFYESCQNKFRVTVALCNSLTTSFYMHIYVNNTTYLGLLQILSEQNL